MENIKDRLSKSIILFFGILFLFIVILSLLNGTVTYAYSLFLSLSSFFAGYSVFKYCETSLDRSIGITQKELDELKTRVRYYKEKEPKYETYIEELLKFSSEELQLIKDMQLSLYAQRNEGGGHD